MNGALGLPTISEYPWFSSTTITMWSGRGGVPFVGVDDARAGEVLLELVGDGLAGVVVMVGGPEVELGFDGRSVEVERSPPRAAPQPASASTSTLSTATRRAPPCALDPVTESGRRCRLRRSSRSGPGARVPPCQVGRGAAAFGECRRETLDTTAKIR
jgi:hypothetical protein